MRLLELYCGIGGCHAALEGRVQSVGAVDVNRQAASVYERNHPNSRVTVADLRSFPVERLRRFEADLWWLSPPCQPFTRRGNQRDVEDPRCESFLALLPKLDSVRPARIGLENVPGFRRSEARRRLLVVLEEAGYEFREQLLCPHTLGWPNRRERYYLVAQLGSLPSVEAPARVERRSLAEFVDESWDRDPRLAVDDAVLSAYQGALDIVDRQDPHALAATFTSAYGRSHVRSGSYLRTRRGVRRFSPPEILALLGFPASWTLPPELSLAAAWKLVGNSLSLPSVRSVLQPFLGAATDSNRSIASGVA